VTHDNRQPAGVMTGTVLKVRLEAVRATWRPEGAEGPVRDIYAFAVEGGAPNIPGPLIRVPEGTELHVFVRNRLPVPLRLHGIGPRPRVKDDFVTMPPGKGLEFRFKSGSAGTFYYWGQTVDSLYSARTGMDSQLTGAFIVDSPTAELTGDRVFVIGEWMGPVPPPGAARKFTIVVNGRSWPYTERLTIPFGLPAEWRVINASVAPHPMHLHGTFYTVESRGSAMRDEVYGAPNRRLVTTELMAPGSTMMMRWVPDRVGNWLFHCHILAHVSARLRDGDAPEAASDDAHAEHDPTRAMAGLVLGITVQPGDETAAPDLDTRVRRRMSLYVREWPNRYGDNSGYGFSLVNQRAPAPPFEAAANPSPPIILMKGEPVVIGVANGISEPFAIHWHGIELESYNDGVPGWSGQSGQIMPAVEPGKTFDVNFAPPRAGTFMYHTHGHDSRQLVSGMYGALVVMEPGVKFDSTVDHIVLLGGAGPGVAGVEMNRSTKPPPMQIKAGIKHRFRFINITPNSTLTVSLRGESGLVQWRAVAKDGAELPPNQAVRRQATLTIGVGETYDFEYQPVAQGELRLEVTRPGVATVQVLRVVR
jgi:FtsP/CotA-like multicopper oxidase with cupredoxin domain